MSIMVYVMDRILTIRMSLVCSKSNLITLKVLTSKRVMVDCSSQHFLPALRVDVPVEPDRNIGLWEVVHACIAQIDRV